MFFGECSACNEPSDDGAIGDDLDYYCNDCWCIHSFRCFTMCALYDLHGNRLSFATSVGGCAERTALWKLNDVHMQIPKIAVVARIRKNSSSRITYGHSLPCSFCSTSLKLYNVVRVAYSVLTTPPASITSDGTFQWEDVDILSSSGKTKCNVVVRI